MNTLHRIREFALVAVLATGALITSSAQAGEVIPGLDAMIERAERNAQVADLGGMTVSAERIHDARIADLGAMTVIARRAAYTSVADLGRLTVTAPRTGTLAVGSLPAGHAWD